MAQQEIEFRQFMKAYINQRVRDQYNTTVYDGPNNLPGQQESEVITSLLGYEMSGEYMMTRDSLLRHRELLEVVERIHCRENLSEIVDSIGFREQITWKKVKLVVVFVQELCVKAFATRGRDSASDILNWLIKAMEDYDIEHWVRRNGGWGKLVRVRVQQTRVPHMVHQMVGVGRGRQRVNPSSPVSAQLPGAIFDSPEAPGRVAAGANTIDPVTNMAEEVSDILRNKLRQLRQNQHKHQLLDKVSLALVQMRLEVRPQSMASTSSSNEIDSSQHPFAHSRAGIDSYPRNDFDSTNPREPVLPSRPGSLEDVFNTSVSPMATSSPTTRPPIQMVRLIRAATGGSPRDFFGAVNVPTPRLCEDYDSSDSVFDGLISTGPPVAVGSTVVGSAQSPFSPTTAPTGARNCFTDVMVQRLSMALDSSDGMSSTGMASPYHSSAARPLGSAFTQRIRQGMARTSSVGSNSSAPSGSSVSYIGSGSMAGSTNLEFMNLSDEDAEGPVATVNQVIYGGPLDDVRTDEGMMDSNRRLNAYIRSPSPPRPYYISPLSPDCGGTPTAAGAGRNGIIYRSVRESTSSDTSGSVVEKYEYESDEKGGDDVFEAPEMSSLLDEPTINENGIYSPSEEEDSAEFYDEASIGY